MTTSGALASPFGRITVVSIRGEPPAAGIRQTCSRLTLRSASCGPADWPNAGRARRQEMIEANSPLSGCRIAPLFDRGLNVLVVTEACSGVATFKKRRVTSTADPVLA